MSEMTVSLFFIDIFRGNSSLVIAESKSTDGNGAVVARGVYV
jgi:hypothetical protein